MTISEHMETFHGLPIFEFPEPGESPALPAPDAAAWRISVFYDAEETWPEAFGRFLAAVDPTTVRAVVVGNWADEPGEGSEDVVAALVEAKDRFPALRALFLGDITYEESEISWINQSDVTPLLTAFPQLTEFGVRGGDALVFPPITHTALRSLTVETGGLGGEVVRGIGASDLPALERLDLWLGVSWYGGTATVADLEPFLSGTRLPRLTTLGLHNSEIQDEIAVAIAAAPVVARLSTLDLSMGTLGDVGAEALLSGQPLTHLRKLDLHHHFMTQSMADRVVAALQPAGVTVDVSESETADAEDRYTAVAE
jgi:hypothetical protein